MKTTASVAIAREPRDVFDFTTEKVEEWSDIVVSDEVLVEKPEMVGTTFRTVTQDGATRMEFEGVVTAHDPPNLHSVIMTGKQFDLHVAYFFKQIGGETEVTQVSVVTPRGWIKALFFLFGRMMKKASHNAIQKELGNLKRLLEEEKK